VSRFVQNFVNNRLPLSYFRRIPKERLFIGKNYIAFKIDVNDIYKLAIRPEDIDFSKKAKIGYKVQIPHTHLYGFLVKLSDDIPHSQNECFDTARDHPDSEIGVIQSYNAESPD
jgi:ABC-type Fe3+/spermidine/putrescine transport system ATPase subunit